MNARKVSRDDEPADARKEDLRIRLTPPVILRCPLLMPENPGAEAPVWDRQGRVPGFSQEALWRLKVLLVGAGALGGEIAEGLVRKGVGMLTILDFDTVDLSNLSRQFFFPEDLGQPKAWALARNLVPHGAMGTRIIAHHLSFENALQAGVDLDCDAVISAVDDGETRVAIAQFALKRNIPALFGGASEAADFASLFVQERDGACFSCAFPAHEGLGRTPCPGSPAIKDLFKLLAGVTLYAVDSLFMDRPRKWNLYGLCPSDPAATRGGTVKRRPDCPVCGGAP